jgi:hypothetical protein
MGDARHEGPGLGSDFLLNSPTYLGFLENQKPRSKRKKFKLDPPLAVSPVFNKSGHILCG